jgi:hypothetical protein
MKDFYNVKLFPSIRVSTQHDSNLSNKIPFFTKMLKFSLTLGLSSVPNVHFGAVFCAEHDAAKIF